jgi:ribonuclease-3
LGDRVLNLAVAAWLYRTYPADSEGELSLRHTHLVRTETCAAVAEHLGVWPAIVLGKNASAAEPAMRNRVLADAMEALLGVVFLRKGMAAVQVVVEAQWAPYLPTDLQANTKGGKDAKTALQELLQGQQLALPQYIEIGKTGPDHAAQFTVRVQTPLGTAEATGPSKAAASMLAAQQLLQRLNDASQ